MATENPRVWFKSISLENVRSFGTKQTINFTDKYGNAARWNVILGDNGTGKTTVLRGIYASISDNSDIDSLTKDYSYFSRYKNVSLEISSLLEINNLTKVSIKHVDLLGDSLSYFSKFSNQTEYILVVRRMIDGKFQNETKKPLQLPVYGYGANRKSGDRPDLEVGKVSKSTYSSLFDDNSEIIDAESWLLRADHVAYRNSNFRQRYDLVKNTLLKLFRGEITDLYIDSESDILKVFAKTHYGDVRLDELSLGYKTLIAWMVDFAKGLFDRYPNSPDPLAEPAVCLVDEIDLHLHPKFQRNIIKFLTETFPNTQFIVTAHSPLIVVAAEERPLDANIILLKREGDQTVVVNDPVDVSKWSVDQILNSDLFGHVPTRSEPLTELHTERDKLLAKAKLTKKDNTRLAALDEKIGFVPFGQDQAEIQAETIIQQLADVLRKQQQVK